jgi:hypothetical protein
VSDEQDDPEASYRRGYQQGARDTLQALQSMPVGEVQGWVDKALFRWRHHDRVKERNLSPPRPWLKPKRMAIKFGLTT